MTMFIVWLVAIISQTGIVVNGKNYVSYLKRSKFVWMNLLPGVYIVCGLALS